jgi:hypothetical protein
MQMRVPLSKEARKNLKARQRASLSGAAGLHDFADDVAEVLDAEGAERAFFDKVRLGQKFGGTLHQDWTAPVSGGACLGSCASAAHLPSCASSASHVCLRLCQPIHKTSPHMTHT